MRIYEDLGVRALVLVLATPLIACRRQLVRLQGSGSGLGFLREGPAGARATHDHVHGRRVVC